MQKDIKKRINRIVDTILDWDVPRRLTLIKRLFDACDYDYERYVLVMLYLYGMRPIELMQIEKSRFLIKERSIVLTLPTAKGGERRTIELSRDTTPFVPFLVNYIQKSEMLLPFTWNDTTNINAVFGKLSKKLGTTRISPYVFRKFRLSYIAIYLDGSAIDLQTWKGSADMRSISPYLRMKPIKKFKDSIR